MTRKLVNSADIKVIDDPPEPRFSIRCNPGGAGFVNYYVADGFPEDVERLLRRYLKHKVTSYELFRDIFREMQFHKIYKSVSNNGEAAELSEEVLIIAKQHMVQAKTFEHSVAGLFLLYSLVHTQPFKRFACVRFLPNDVPAISKVITEARSKNSLDVLYVIGSLLIEGPTEFNVANKDYGLERQYRKHFENKISTNGETMRLGVLKKDCEEKEALRSLSLAVRKYNDAKSKIPQCEGFEVNSYINSDLPEELYAELLMLLRKDYEGPPPNEVYRNRKSVKLRALKNLVNDVPHLVSVIDPARDASAKQAKTCKGKNILRSDKEADNKTEVKTKGKGGKTKNTKKRKAQTNETDETPEADIEAVSPKLEEDKVEAEINNEVERGTKRTYNGSVKDMEMEEGGREGQAGCSVNMPDLSDCGEDKPVTNKVLPPNASLPTINELFGDDIKSDDEDDDDIKWTL